MGSYAGPAAHVYINRFEYDVRVVVLGEDFTALGPAWGLDWYKALTQSHYQVRGARQDGARTG